MFVLNGCCIVFACWPCCCAENSRASLLAVECATPETAFSLYTIRLPVRSFVSESSRLRNLYRTQQIPQLYDTVQTPHEEIPKGRRKVRARHPSLSWVLRSSCTHSLDFVPYFLGVGLQGLDGDVEGVTRLGLAGLVFPHHPCTIEGHRRHRPCSHRSCWSQPRP